MLKDKLLSILFVVLVGLRGMLRGILGALHSKIVITPLLLFSYSLFMFELGNFLGARNPCSITITDLVEDGIALVIIGCISGIGEKK